MKTIVALIFILISTFSIAQDTREYNYLHPMFPKTDSRSVEIESKNGGKTIEVKGQKSHTYTFLINSDTKPRRVTEADKWDYNLETKQTKIIKHGTNFKLNIN